MKITTCQFNDSYFPIMDGVGMTAHNYAYWLDRKYGEAFLVAPKVKGYKDNVNYKVFRFKSVILPGMSPYRVGFPMIDISFKKKMKRVQFDLLHAHSPFVSGRFAQKLALELNIPLVTTFHSKYREDFKKVFDNELFADFMMHHILDFYNSADLVCVPNYATGETLKEYGYTGNFEIIPNGTDMEIPDKSEKQKLHNKGLARFGFDTHDFVLLFVGQHRWEKNVKMIIEALKILKADRKSFKMVFVGEGYASKEMKKMVHEMELKDHVVFTGPIIDRNELRTIYGMADLFVFPSLYDNSPLVIQEAAAFTVPCIVVNDSSSSEGITDKVNGFLIDNSSESLAKIITKLMKRPEIIQQAGVGARNSLYKNWESIVEGIHLRYKETIKEHRQKNAIRSQANEGRKI
jgi:1,2-diacylglycerol 3-alpha-glucosyltransferase